MLTRFIFEIMSSLHESIGELKRYDSPFVFFSSGTVRAFFNIIENRFLPEIGRDKIDYRLAVCALH
jgi:hypothetical protein